MKRKAICLVGAALMVFTMGTQVFAEQELIDISEVKIGATGLLQDQFTQVLINGYEAAGEEFGVEVIAANSQYSLETEAEKINNMIEAGCQGVIIECVEPDSTVAIAEQAHDAGLAVFAAARELHTDCLFASCLNDCYDLGEAVGIYAQDWFAENFDKDEEIKAGVIAFDSTDANGSAGRIDGFFDQLKDYNINVVLRKDGTSYETSLQVAQDFLTAEPDLDVIFAASETGVVGAVQAIEAIDGCECRVFGVDCSEQIVEMLHADNDILQGTIAQDPWTQAFYSVEAMINYLTKGEVPEEEVFHADGVLLTRSDLDHVDEWLETWKEHAAV